MAHKTFEDLPTDQWHDLNWWAKKEGRSRKTIRSWTHAGLKHFKWGASVQVHEQHMTEFKLSKLRGGHRLQAAE